MAHASTHTHRRDPGRALAAGLALTLGFALVEVILGAVSGSLALISDAGHMLVDSAGLLLALAATLMARRPSDLRRTYGYGRVEVLAVPVHVVLMVVLAGYIVFESVQRIGDAPDIDAGPVLAAGLIGLAVNVVVLRLLHGHSHTNLNARGAVYEVAADTLGSAGVIVSAIVIMATGWTGIDVIISLAIAALVVPRAIALLNHSVGILLESTPPGISTAAIERDALAVPGVVALHDLHVWSLAPSFVALSAHVEVETMAGCEAPIARLNALLREKYGIDHVTLQPETHELHEAMECCSFPDAGSRGADHDHHPVAAASRR